MGKRASVYFRDRLLELVRRDGVTSVSGRLEAVADRYIGLLDHHGIVLSDRDATLLEHSLAGEDVTSATIEALPRLVASRFHAPELIARLESASYADRLAAVERAEVALSRRRLT